MLHEGLSVLLNYVLHVLLLNPFSVLSLNHFFALSLKVFFQELDSTIIEWLFDLRRSLIFAILPDSLLDDLSFWIVEGALARLFPILPLSLIDLFVMVSEGACSLLFSMLVVSLIGRSVWPNELAPSMILSIFPFPLVVGIVRVFGVPLTMRNKVPEGDFTFILFAFSIDESSFILRVVIQENCVRFGFVMRIIDGEVACDGF